MQLLKWRVKDDRLYDRGRLIVEEEVIVMIRGKKLIGID